MKKIFSIIVLGALILSLCACEAVETNNNRDKIKIVTTIFPPSDFAVNIACEEAEVTQLLYPGAESHTYEPTPKDIIAIKEADLFIFVGGESDTWIRDTLLSGELKGINTLAMMDVISLYQEEHKDDKDHEKQLQEKEEYDEHVWTTPKNAVKICEAICDSLCKIDESKSDIFKRNTENYTKNLKELDQKFRDMISVSKRKTIVFGDRFPFLYFAKEYGLDYFAAFSGCSSDTEPSASTVSYLIDKVNKDKIPVVFYLEFSSQVVADIICEDTDAKKLMLHSCHNITAKDKEAGISYLYLMNLNLQNLTEALN